MAVDFSFAPDVEEVRGRVRAFMDAFRAQILTVEPVSRAKESEEA